MNSARRLPGRRLMSSSLTRPQLIAIGLGLWLVFVCTTLRIGDLGASAIAFDMVFPEPDRLSPARVVQQPEVMAAFGGVQPRVNSPAVADYDQVFAAAMRGKPVILGFAAIPGANDHRPGVKAGLAFTGEDPRSALPSFAAATRNLPELDDAPQAWAPSRCPPSTLTE